MKESKQSPRKRDIKFVDKIKDEVEADTSPLTQNDSLKTKPSLEDLIICQICKDPVEKDHKMCPK